MKFLMSAGLLAAAAFASASVQFNDMLVNPPSADEGFEYIELKTSTPGESLAGVWLLVIEGEGTTAGMIDQAIDLSAHSTGSNSLLLIRDTAGVLAPAPDPNTTLVIHNFTPDIENGTQTYALVRGFTGAVGVDYDSDNNGVLESTPWTSVDDAFAYDDFAGTDFKYAAQIGGVNFVSVGWAPSCYLRLPDGTRLVSQWVTGTLNPGPYVLDPARVANPAGGLLTPPTGYALSPGSANPPFAVDIFPSNAVVTSGFLLGGGAAQLAASDDDKMFVLCDETVSTGAVVCTGTGAPTNPASILVTVEHVAARSDLTLFIRALNYVTNVYDSVAVTVSALTDQVTEGTISSNAPNYVDNGTVRLEMTWIPQNDLDAADGWSMGLDMVRWRLQ